MSFLNSYGSSNGGGSSASMGGGDSFQYLTSADKEKLAEFESFRAAFASAKASKLAR
jgi:hypothetical protein